MDQTQSERLTRAFLVHQDMLVAYLRSLVGNAPDADDLFQELGVVVLRKTPGDLPHGEDFGKWARGIARNLVRHHFRKRKRRREAVWDEFYDLVDQSYEEANEVDYSAERTALAGCMQRLEPRQTALLQRHYTDGESLDAIAQSLGKEASAVRMAVWRLRKRLYACIRAALGTTA